MIGTTTSWYWPKVLGVPVTPESRKLPNEKNRRFRRFRHFCHFLEFFLICAYRVTSDMYSIRVHVLSAGATARTDHA